MFSIEYLSLPLLGGILIGLSSALLLVFNGRIAGISGILGGAMQRPHGDYAWRFAFLGGLLVAGGAYSWLAPSAFVNSLGLPLSTVALAGVLVGFGTRLGSGCTSGHGVCGLSRLSARSLTSVLTFIATGAVVVYVVHHLG